MSFIPTPQGVEVTFHGAIGDQPCVNVIHVNVNSAVLDADLTIIAGICDDWFINDILPQVTADYGLLRTVAKDISVENGAEQEVVHSPTEPGTGTGAGLPANAALVTTFGTAKTGRSYRGRFYLGGLRQNAQVSVQTMDGTFAGVIAGTFTDLIDGLNAFSYTLSVLSKVANGVARVAGVLTEIITVITNTRIDTQRRRVNNSSG